MIQANDRIACVAIVGPITDKQQTIHSCMGSGGSQRFMAFPEVVLAEGDKGSVMLYRYRCDGEFCGDTWHASLEEAQGQAQHEYGPALGYWSPVPRDTTKTHEYAIAFARENRAAKQ